MVTVEEMKEYMTKVATGETKEITYPSATSEGAKESTSELDKLFTHKEGLAHRDKENLNKYFDTKSKRYAMRKQTFVEKVAHVVKLLRLLG